MRRRDFGDRQQLYGTTSAGGFFGTGAVFEVEHTSSGGLAEKILHSFTNKGTGGSDPLAGLIFDPLEISTAQLPGAALMVAEPYLN